jgi:thiamine-phosphate pyrophosphorylase
VSFNLPKVYPITDTSVSGLSHTEQVERLLEGGATIIQLREKQTGAQSFFKDAVAALRLARAAGAKLIINDRVDVALAVQADGVHLGQTDMPVEAARRLLGENSIIGFSTHTLEQARMALNLNIDYLAFGPIYPTATKQNPDAVTGLSDLFRVKALAGSLPVVAIGGINFENIHEVMPTGADSVAVIAAVLSNPSRIAQNLRHLSQIAGNNS